jgi:hypothetical protein
MITENNPWKSEAKAIQLRFKEKLGLKTSGTHGGVEYTHILSDQDAALGANFYCNKNEQEWDDLKNWANTTEKRKVDFLGNGLKNLLRSEHIPFNIFYPLEKIRTTDPEKLNELLSKIIKREIDGVTEIRIEFAGIKDKSDYLDDNTSFDAYIQAVSNGKKIGLGIEVKYTELSYPWGKTEKERMFDLGSEYNLLSSRMEYYNDTMRDELRTKKLKQVWRNHLLGIKMVELGELNEFYSIHFYPEGNSYQQKVADDYLKCLNHDNLQSFIPLTFQHFSGLLKECQISGVWVDYFEQRY